MAGLIPFNRNKSILSNGRFDDFNNMLDDFFADVMPSRFLNSDTFKIDVRESDGVYIIEAELPGINKEEVDLELNEGRLTITVEREENADNSKGNYIHKERRYGSMKRTVYLADVVNENVEAAFDNGLLKISIPKVDKKKNSLKIDIK